MKVEIFEPRIIAMENNSDIYRQAIMGNPCLTNPYDSVPVLCAPQVVDHTVHKFLKRIIVPRGDAQTIRDYQELGYEVTYEDLDNVGLSSYRTIVILDKTLSDAIEGKESYAALYEQLTDARRNADALQKSLNFSIRENQKLRSRTLWQRLINKNC